VKLTTADIAALKKVANSSYNARRVSPAKW
jgi:hypothetical protein